MKKIYLLIPTILLFSGCREDENSESDNLIGVWKRSKYEIRSGKDNSVLETIIPDNCEKKTTNEFTKEKKIIIKEFYENTNGNCISDDIQYLNYSYEPSTKKLTIDGATDDVLKLTKSELQIKDNYHYDDNGDGFDDIYIDYYNK